MTRIRTAVLAAVAGFSALSAASLAPAAAAAPLIFHHPNAAVPGTNGSQSGNWSGYARSGSYSSITGRWKVPSVARSSGSTYSSNWIGIDGYNNSNLIQTGTASEYWGGAAHYYAWWEILPAPETTIPSVPVKPGDVMTADVHKVSGVTWSISITDTTTGKSFTTTKNYTGLGQSAEWIEEAPSSGVSVLNLAHYSTTYFDPGTANNGNPGLSSADSIVMIQHGKRVSTPSSPDSERDGFNVAYGSRAPSPPPS